MGFEPQGENLSLIMVEVGKEKNAGHYVVETRTDELIKELNIDKNRITGVSAAWSVKTMATTALLCFQHCSIHLFKSGCQQTEQKYDMGIPDFACYWRLHHSDAHSLLIQRRITTLSDQYLANRDQQRNADIEAAGDTKKYQMTARRIAPGCCYASSSSVS